MPRRIIQQIEAYNQLLDKAACKGMDPAYFFPLEEDRQQEVAQFCAACVMREACLEYALINGIDHGVWGGTTEVERRALRRQHNRHQAPL